MNSSGSAGRAETEIHGWGGFAAKSPECIARGSADAPLGGSDSGRVPPRKVSVNESGTPYVLLFVSYVTRAAFLWTLCSLLAVAQTSITGLLKQVEDRYNGAKTLVLDFEQVYSGQGAERRPETGTVHFDKPGKMRWDYSSPKGKVFLAEDKEYVFYNPRTNRVERGKVKESQDFRAPFAFLLGRIDFTREFDRFVSRPEDGNTRITARPKSDKFPYKQVSFLITPDSRIAELELEGKDDSVMAFRFRNEKRNVPVPDKLFRFDTPAGAEIVEISE